MKLLDLIDRSQDPEPWAGDWKIPWDEPGFSKRMLREHLDPAHDAASRRGEKIDVHVDWIEAKLLPKSGRILDLGCGPGLYANRLAARGHAVVGVDFSPASIEHARCQAEEAGHDATFVRADIRGADLPGRFDLAMLLFGEANAFPPEDLSSILQRAHAALENGGRLLLEAHTEDAVRRIGARPPIWYTAERGLFSDAPHLCLRESFWNEARRTATDRWTAVDLRTHDTSPYHSSLQAYSDAEYEALLVGNGFERPVTFADMGAPQPDLAVLVAARP